MQWEVTGTDRQLGEEKTIYIEADDEAQARRRANRAGLMVVDLRPLDPTDSVAGNQLAPPPMVAPPVLPNDYVPPQPVVVVPPASSVNVVNQVWRHGPLTNGWGIASVIVGTIAITLSFIPCVGLIATIPLATAGAILALVGVIIGYSYGRPVLASWLGGGMSLLAVLIAILITVILAVSANNAAPAPMPNRSRPIQPAPGKPGVFLDTTGDQARVASAPRCRARAVSARSWSS